MGDFVVHELKTDPVVFDAVKAGIKAYEIRFNDRNFKVGDTLVLHKTRYSGEDMRAGANLEYTGDKLECKVTHILRGPIYGLGAGWVIMSIAAPQPVQQPKADASQIAQSVYADMTQMAEIGGVLDSLDEELTESIIGGIAETIGNALRESLAPSVQQPIPISERLPLDSDNDDCGHVAAFRIVSERWQFVPAALVRECYQLYSHWTPTGLKRPAEPAEPAEQLYAIYWRNKLTGETGCGDSMKEILARQAAECGNREFPSTLHWVEPAEPEGGAE